MSTNIKDAKSVSNIPPMESGTYAAVGKAVIDLGLQETTFEGKARETNQILIMWEFPDELIELEGEMKPRTMFQTYTMSTHEKAKLRKTLQSWRGRDFTEQELRDFDIANVIGAPCMITVTQTEKNGNTYANVSAVGKIMRGVSVQLTTDGWHFDIDNQDTWAIFPILPEWIQKKINSSLTLRQKGLQIDRNGQLVNMGNAMPQDDLPFDNDNPPMPEDSDLPF